MLTIRNSLLGEISPSGGSALFIDRDGVVNEDYNYVYKRDDVDFIDGIFPLCRQAMKQNYLIVIVTNQAGIARGYYTEREFCKLSSWMLSKFAAEGVTIASIYACPHHPISRTSQYRKECPNRKPNPGMILAAQLDYNLNLSDSILIGDKFSDIEAGRNAGIRKLLYYAPEADPPKMSSGFTVIRTLSEGSAWL